MHPAIAQDHKHHPQSEGERESGVVVRGSLPQSYQFKKDITNLARGHPGRNVDSRDQTFEKLTMEAQHQLQVSQQQRQQRPEFFATKIQIVIADGGQVALFKFTNPNQRQTNIIRNIHQKHHIRNITTTTRATPSPSPSPPTAAWNNEYQPAVIQFCRLAVLCYHRSAPFHNYCDLLHTKHCIPNKQSTNYAGMPLP
jgi:hypothetical protein